MNITPVDTATQLVVTTQPPASVTAGTGFGLTVTAEDSFGDLDPNFDGTVTLTLNDDTGSAALGGTLLRGGQRHGCFRRPENRRRRYGLRDHGGGKRSGLELDDRIRHHRRPGHPVSGDFQPATEVLAGNTFPLVVSAEDAFGNVDPSFDSVVTLALGTNPAVASLGGIFRATAIHGIATFSGPIIDQACDDDTLVANGGGLPAAATSPFNVTASTAPSITIELNYSYDTSGFFTTNPQAKALMQEAAQILGSELHSNLAAITPDPGLGESWAAYTFNPSDPNENISFSNLSVPANTIIVYVGGSDVASTSGGDYGGVGGPGDVSLGNVSSSWANLVELRGQAGALANPPTGFGPWGGSVSFNTSVDWDFSDTLGSSFLKTAMHELCHVLGIGTAGSWYSYVNSSTNLFTGPHADASFGGPVPLDTTIEPQHPDSHWATGVVSDGNVPLMYPYGGAGVVTPLDWAGLDDIGWLTDDLVITAEPPQPVSASAGFKLTVTAVDPDGQVDTIFDGTVTLALGNNPGDASLGGTLTATAVNGIATFSGLTIGQIGNGYTLLATSSALPSVTTTTAPFDVTASPTPTPTPTPPPTSTWVNPSGGDWYNPDNWSPEVVPTSTDAVIIGVSVTDPITAAQAVSVASLSSIEPIIIDGASITIGGAAELSGSGLAHTR